MMVQVVMVHGHASVVVMKVVSAPDVVSASDVVSANYELV